MDGTLIDSLSYWESFWRAFGLKYFGEEHFDYDKEVDLRVRTMIFREVLPLIRSHYGLSVSVEELGRFASDSLADFYENEASVKAGVREFLAHLKQEGIKLCLASATEKLYINTALDRHGMRKYFRAVLSCADIGKGKEEPDMFEAALEVLGTPKEETVVFEDSYVALETAARAGFPTVGIFDRHAFEQERLKNSATYYVADGETMMKLVPFEE